MNAHGRRLIILLAEDNEACGFYHIKDVIDQFVTQFDSNSKPLQLLFTETIADIFGLNGKLGFHLHEIDYSSHPVEHDLVFKFLHPLGPFFKLCYKLVEENCILDYPIAELPLAVSQDISHNKCSVYYRSKLNTNLEIKDLISLPLNPFEYYIFQFVSYLVTYKFNCKNKHREKDKENEHCQKATLYLRLCEEYITTFLPCGNVQVIPYVPVPVTSPHRKISHPTFSNTQKTTTYIRHDLQTNILEAAYELGLHTGGLSDEIWRSFLFLNITIDFWASLPAYNTISDFPSLPSPDNICAVRYLLKHLHDFSNSDTCSHSKMDSFRREVFPLYQRKIYNFIRTTIIHWPHDTTFSLILETWLTYIQPWRYATSTTSLDVLSFLGPGSEQLVSYIDARWLTFIRDNFLFYTVIFQLVLRHFRNANFSMLKHVAMLIRPLKVYATTNLGTMIYEIEYNYLYSKTSCFQNIKWVEGMQHHFTSLEGQTFVYTPVFSGDFLREVVFLYDLLNSYKTLDVQQSTVLVKKENISWYYLKKLLSFKSSIKEDDHKVLLSRLSVAMQLLLSLFNFHPPGLESDSVMERSEISETYSFCGNSRMPDSARKAEYTGDPDLLPVQTFEISILVRMFYLLSGWINTNHGHSLAELYNKQGYIGLLARSLLAEPKEIVNLDRSGIFRSLAVTRQLPPRISLRFLAHRLIYIYIIIFVTFCMLIGISITNAFLCLFGCILILVICFPLIFYTKLKLK